MSKHPLAELLSSVPPHLMLRRYTREEDSFAVIRVFLDGCIQTLSNDTEFAKKYLRGVFLEAPPSFHTEDEPEKYQERSRRSGDYTNLEQVSQSSSGWHLALRRQHLHKEQLSAATEGQRVGGFFLGQLLNWLYPSGER
ncbi:MAG: hypothetical protein M3Q91_15680 [Acidobacteriota bacterium]|nr:hypothetical protein [Acidobacteriota bacterium]